MLSTEDKKIDATESENTTTEFQSQEPDYKDQYLRLHADFQNLKRRMERERSEWAQTMQGDVIEKILPFADDLERALQSAEKNDGIKGWLDGFQLILKNLHKTLSELGVEEVVATGAFNPELHEALIHVDSVEHQSGEIVQILSKGYKHKGRVLRHARVSVAK